MPGLIFFEAFSDEKIALLVQSNPVNQFNLLKSCSRKFESAFGKSSRVFGNIKIPSRSHGVSTFEQWLSFRLALGRMASHHQRTLYLAMKKLLSGKLFS